MPEFYNSWWEAELSRRHLKLQTPPFLRGYEWECLLEAGPALPFVQTEMMGVLWGSLCVVWEGICTSSRPPLPVHTLTVSVWFTPHSLQAFEALSLLTWPTCWMLQGLLLEKVFEFILGRNLGLGTESFLWAFR